MKKELTFLLDITPAQVGDDASAFENFGLTAERASFLITAFDRRIKAIMANEAGWGIINDVEEFCLFVEQNALTGHDIAFLTFTGWRAARMSKEICTDTIKNLLGQGALNG